MTAAALPHRLAKRRAALLLGGALLWTGPALGQAFQGTPTVVAGTATRAVSANSETITISSPSAIINWAPGDVEALGTIDFLPFGNTATFQNGPNNPDFMVLNRILPTVASRPVALNGTVISQLQTAAGTVRGGTVAFYSPGGILIGPGAVIDVGRLLLTTIDPITGQNGDFFINGKYDLNGAVDPASFVTVSAGAKISALQEGSYVAIASPRILQQGDVRVNGSAAYVAGEAMSLTINGGLFDIEVQTGTAGSTTPLIHEGNTGGPGSGGAGDNHRIYMVAVPKNQAITALLSGSAGFDAAQAAGVVNGEIILSAGRSIVGEAFVDAPKLPPSSFDVTGGTYTSSIRGTATDVFRVGGTAAGFTLTGNLSIQGDAKAELVAIDKSVVVSGNAEIRSDQILSGVGPNGIDAAAGQALVTATGDALVRVGGSLIVSASARGGVDAATSTAGSGTGGAAQIKADGGLVDLLGNVIVLAQGEAGSAKAVPLVGGNGAGGSATINAVNAGTVSVAGTTDLSASGSAGVSSAANGTGGTGKGGQAGVSAAGKSTITLAAAANIGAQGLGGDNLGANGAGGQGVGGDVFVTADDATVSLNGGGQALALGAGGRGFLGGTGAGGTARVEAARGNIGLGGGFLVSANGVGGDALGTGARAGNGKGGTAFVIARSGVAPSTITANDLFVFAAGTGGAGGTGSGGAAGGRGGDGTGGSATLASESGNAIIKIAKAQVEANGVGGAGGAGDADSAGGRGGDGTGGTAVTGTVAGPEGTLPTGFASIAQLNAAAMAMAGKGGASGTVPGLGGNAAGGSVSLFSRGARVDVPAATLLASAFAGQSGQHLLGGPAGATGSAKGGTIALSATRVDGTDGFLNAGSVTGSAVANGTNNVAGAWDVAVKGGRAEFATLALSAGAVGTPSASRASSVTVEDGPLKVAGALALTSGGDIPIIATRSGIVQAGAISLAAPSGSVTISHNERPPGANTISAGSLASVSAGAFTQGAGSRIAVAGSASIKSGGDIALTDAAFGGELTADSGGTIVVGGPVTAQAMGLTSADVAIAPGAALGSAATTQIAFTVRQNGGPAVIGGNAAGPGYTLDAAEISRITAQQLRFIVANFGADPARAADVILRDFVLSGTEGGNGLRRFEVAAVGRIRVEGRIDYAKAGPTDLFLLNAGERVQVVTPAGGIFLTDAAERPGGTLQLNAPLVTATDAALAAQFAANPNFAGRGAALLANSGPAAPLGYLLAGGIGFTVGSGLFIQNSGSAADLAGLTVGANGLAIRATSPAPIAVVGFGRKQNVDGTFTAGAAFFGQIDFGKAAGTRYDDEAEFNRCNINASACPAPPKGDPGPGKPPGDAPPSQRPPARSTLVGPFLLPGEAVQEERLEAAFAAEPLIEEPVASGGDSSLWTDGGEDEDDEDEAATPSPRQ